MSANDWMLMLSGDQVLPTDAPWPMSTTSSRCPPPAPEGRGSDERFHKEQEVLW